MLEANPSSVTTSIDCETDTSQPCVLIDGHSLDLSQVQSITEDGYFVSLARNIDESTAFEKSAEVLLEKLEKGHKIYGVNTLFGGLANQEAECPHKLQQHLILSHMAGAGEPLPDIDVKLAMVLRSNSHCHLVSGIRKTIVERYLTLANQNIVPLVQEYGSIGASGDLVPLSAIAGAVTGQSNQFKLKVNGIYTDAIQALDKIAMKPIPLLPKEGLALINGTSVLTAIAANNCVKMRNLFDLHLSLQVALCEILQCDMRPFHAFVHHHRPHPGQVWVAEQLRGLLSSSQMTRSAAQVEHDFDAQQLVQDRYSIRCMPQFLGAIVEDLRAIFRSVTIEMNSATDNPLIDYTDQEYYHGGNFLGQHIAMAMDKMRICIALLAKHNEAQLALLVEPQFSNGLPPSLVPEPEKALSVGIKPLQILSNSLTPLLEQKANPLSTHFPVHAEQFNQNINSQGFGAANITRETIEIFSQQIAAMYITVCHAVLLKASSLGERPSVLYSDTTNALVTDVLKHLKQQRQCSGGLVSVDNGGNLSAWVNTLYKAINSGQLKAPSALLEF